MKVGIHLRAELLSLRASNEPVSIEGFNLTCAPIEDSNLSAHPHSLIRVFDGRSVDRQGSNVFFQEENYGYDQIVRIRRRLTYFLYLRCMNRTILL